MKGQAPHRLLSVGTITTVGLACKAFLRLGFCKSVQVSGLHHLLGALSDAERDNGRGIVTVSNHISTLDDPLAWGILPTRCYLNLRNMRWTLGASDIMFTNPVFSAFFRNGQVLETFRGKGVFQPALDTAIEKLNRGGWVHLFGEGKVNQPYQYELLRRTKEAAGGGVLSGKGEGLVARLPRFKWGTGRIVMEARRLPVIIPMWISGFENIMPEPRPNRIFPANFLPRLRQSVSITFAPPLDPTPLLKILSASHIPHSQGFFSPSELGNDYNSRSVSVSQLESVPEIELPHPDSLEKRRIREAVTEILQRAVEQLGYAVSGPLLGCPIELATDPKPFTERPS